VVLMSGIKRTKEDAKLSDYVRWERDQGMCQRCLKQYTKPSGGLHAAHCFTRRTKATRLEADNLLALCFGCHQFVDSHAEEKENLWRLRIGNERYDRIAALAHQKRDRVS
jgi:hypothetical protein